MGRLGVWRRYPALTRYETRRWHAGLYDVAPWRGSEMVSGVWAFSVVTRRSYAGLYDVAPSRGSEMGWGVSRRASIPGVDTMRNPACRAGYTMSPLGGARRSGGTFGVVTRRWHAGLYDVAPWRGADMMFAVWTYGEGMRNTCKTLHA